MTQTPLDTLLDAALPNVAFDGWSPATFREAVKDSGLSMAEAQSVAPRGAIDLAVAYHRRSDTAMVERLSMADLDGLRFRDKVATALRYRIEAMDDREAVRRASALFSLPHNAPEGARLVWETADHVWTALGDTSRDFAWYTKRATLSGVWGATVLFWLGDDSEGAVDTLEFIDRRIEDVMQFEKLKASMRDNPLTKPFADMQAAVLSRFKAPDMAKFRDLPGRWAPPQR